MRLTLRGIILSQKAFLKTENINQNRAYERQEGIDYGNHSVGARDEKF